MAIDTLAYAKALEAAGVDRQAAEAHAEALSEALAHHVLPDLATKTDLEALRAATKADLDAHRAATKADLDAYRAETKADLEAHRAETRADLDALEHRLTIAIERQTVRIFGMVLGVVGLLDAILFALLRFIR